ncbi:ROK family protein [Rhodoferax sp.]|uniref:ROK family protein n=1 Tax=Rhodoferax sp. TaxID=50421 RepID=UPI0025D311F0|nr:ROK family protein [Rhodoferax sp.]
MSVDETTLLQTIFWSVGASRLALSERLDFSKSKTNSLVAALLDVGLLTETGLKASSGGRRPETVQINPSLGVLIAADLGATSLDIAILRPDLSVLARHSEAADVRAGPGLVMARVRVLMRELLAQCATKPQQVIGIGMGVPGPVDFASGQLVNPPLMPQWDSFSIRDALREDFAAPVFVDNDVNTMALGELWRLQRSLQNFLVIKVGTSIGCGIVCHGEVYRGANGSAGDVGHICVDTAGPRCHCGNLGCVEAMAAGPAITRMALEAAISGESALLAACLADTGSITPEDVGNASRHGDAAANRIIQHTGNLIGQMLASVVNFFSPSHVFIGGGITRIGPLFLASVRQSIYQRSLALSTRHLEIQYTPLAEQAGLVGAGVLAMQETLKNKGSPR